MFSTSICKLWASSGNLRVSVSHELVSMSTDDSTKQEVQEINPVPGEAPKSSSTAPPSRWLLLKRFLLKASKEDSAANTDNLSEVSRRPAGRYNLVQWRVLSTVLQNEELTTKDGSMEAGCMDASSDVVVEYTLPVLERIKLNVRQRGDGKLKLSDFAACRKNSIDSTGIVCLWPAEEVLTYFCVRHPEVFRAKTIVELGSGYGLGGLAIAACTDAEEVVITDGNPQVVDYIAQNIRANADAFGNTIVSGSALYWSRDQIPLACRTFDLIVAADCTFFKDFHVDLACTIKSLLGPSKGGQAILFNPRRGDTLDLFVRVAESQGLIVEMKEHYDADVWDSHQQFLKTDQTGWPNYDSNHCYPILLTLTVSPGKLQ